MKKPLQRVFFACILAFTGLLSSNVPVNALTVPFLSQAPLGQWKDWRQAQGCEEAVSIMGMAWAKGWKEIDKKWGRDQIVAMSNWEKERYGYYVDTSIKDTANRLIQDYLNFKNVTVVKNITVKNVAAEIVAGHLVIVPIDGRIIGKPYYAHGGPRHHVLVVVDYDRETDIFTFHDPGKTLGMNKTITGPKLQAAMRDYPSGNGSSRLTFSPNMIVVEKITDQESIVENE